MAKKALKTQGNPVGYKQTRAKGDIEFLFTLYRELNEKVAVDADIAYLADAKVRATLADHGERIVALEYEGSQGGLPDEEVDAMVLKLMAARPWYVKLASWVQKHEEAAMWTIGGVVTLGVLVALIAR
jgi:hypothetical protein